MAQQIIGIGSAGNDGNGDALRVAGQKINDNFTDLYTNKIATSVLDTDGTLTANSDAKIATQKAVRTAINALIGANDVETYKGVIDCSANPNYPAADAGHVYRVSVAGKIGGASGTNVEIGDRLQCITDGTASGNQATVGANWWITQTNIDGAVTGPASSTSGNIATFSGTSGKAIQDGGKVLPTGALVGLSDTQTLTNKTLTSPVVNSPTGIVKGDVGLGNVDNTSDATKNSASATLTNKTLTSPTITNGLHTAASFNPGANDSAAVAVSGAFGGGILFKDSTGRAGFWCQSTGAELYMGVGGTSSGTTAAVILTATDFSPNADNTVSCGKSGHKWKEIFSNLGAINTSHAAEKTPITEVDEGYLLAALDTPQGKYQWLESIARKGADKARFHFGITAQSFRDACLARGVDPTRFGGYCEDPVLAPVKKIRVATRPKMGAVDRVVVEDGRPVLKSVPRAVVTMQEVTDESGKPVMVDEPDPENEGETVSKPMLHPVPVMEEFEEEYFEEQPTGEKQYGLRYDQFDRLVNEARWRVYRGKLKWSPRRSPA